MEWKWRSSAPASKDAGFRNSSNHWASGARNGNNSQKRFTCPSRMDLTREFGDWQYSSGINDEESLILKKQNTNPRSGEQ
jgi:hypothetical protein